MKKWRKEECVRAKWCNPQISILFLASFDSECPFCNTNMHDSDSGANQQLTGLRRDYASTIMLSLKFVNTKMYNNKVVLIENTKTKCTIQGFSYPPIYYLCTLSMSSPPPPIRRSLLSVAVSGSSGPLFFSSIFSPVWQLGKKLLACQKCPWADSLGQLRGTHWCKLLCLLSPFLLAHESGPMRHLLWFYPFSIFQKMAVQSRPGPACCHSTLQCQGKVPAAIKLRFPLFYFAIVPVLKFPLEFLQKSGLAGDF